MVYCPGNPVAGCTITSSTRMVSNRTLKLSGNKLKVASCYNSPFANKAQQQQPQEFARFISPNNTLHRTNKAIVYRSDTAQRNRFCHSKVIFRAYLCNMTNYFDSYRVPDLQKYLRSRGVSVTGYNKPILKEIAIAVQKLELPEDPDFLRDSVQDCVIKKLTLAGLQNYKPLEHPGYTSDFTNIPEFGLIDIFNYLIFNRSDYDGKKLKGYKSYDDYRLFYDGNVEVLEFNDLGDHRNCLFRAKVKPTQKDKTFLNKDFYELWIVLDKEDGYVITAHCECKGGADGACRHVAASLYELEAFEKKSCTEGDNQWMKRPRHHDIPVPIRNLSVVKAKYGPHAEYGAVKPHVDLFDPRIENQRHDITEDGKREFALQLQQVSQNAQVLDILLQPEDRISHEKDCVESSTISNLALLNKAKEFVQNVHVHSKNRNDKLVMCKDFINTLSYSDQNVSDIMEATHGQSENKLWYSVRKGMLTASVFSKANHYIDKQAEPPASFMKIIMGENQFQEQYLPAPLKWGRNKEPIARMMYQRLHRRNHFSLKVLEKGFLLSKEYPCLGCSVDGVITCKCKPPHPDKLMEIKCPFACRDMTPKEAAVEKNISYNKQTLQWEVTSKCPYYAQIQGQLGLFGLTECELVIYTRHGIHISKAIYDHEFFTEMVQKLLLFHEKYVMPCIINRFLPE